MKCPTCAKARLEPLEVGDVLLDQCETCAGIWFDHGELEAVVGTTTASTLEDSKVEERSGLCPRCAIEMVPVAASQDPTRPVLVDRCPSCMGLWLPRNRLQDIEGQRVPLSVRELFVGPEADAQAVKDLPDSERELVLEAEKLLQSHPMRTALLAYLERGLGGSDPCPDQ